MGVTPPISPNDAREVLSLLATLNAPFTEDQARALVAQRRWQIDADAPGEALIASGHWAGGEEAVSFAFEDGNTTDIMIAAVAGLAKEDAAKDSAINVFAMLVNEATDLFGPRSGEIVGERPRAWWIMPHQTVSVSRWQAAATITWSPNEVHEALLKSIREDQ